MVRALDALGPLGSFHPLGALGPLDALRPLGPFDSLGALGPFCTLRPLDALVSLHTGDPFWTIFAAIGAAVFTPVLAPVLAAVLAAIFAPVGARFTLGTQFDSQAVVVLAQPHALEVQLARELLDGLRDLLALLHSQAALADAHVACASIKQRADLGDELLNVDRAGSVARHIELDLLTLIFTAIFASVLTAVLASIFPPVSTAVFPPVLLAYVGLCQRPDRLGQRRKKPDRSNSGCDEASARHGIPFQGD